MNSLIFNNDVAMSCNCIGSQNNEPYCPCQMREKGVFKRNGRWIEPEKDLGPVISFNNPVYENTRARRDNMSKIGDLDYEI